MIGEDLKHFRASPDKTRRLAITLATTAFVMLFVTGSWQFRQSNAAPQASPTISPAPSPAEAATTYEDTASHYAAIVAACMRGDQFIWQDPHTGSDFVAFCHVVELGRVGR